MVRKGPWTLHLSCAPKRYLTSVPLSLQQPVVIGQSQYLVPEPFSPYFRPGFFAIHSMQSRTPFLFPRALREHHSAAAYALMTNNFSFWRRHFWNIYLYFPDWFLVCPSPKVCLCTIKSDSSPCCSTTTCNLHHNYWYSEASSERDVLLVGNLLVFACLIWRLVAPSSPCAHVFLSKVRNRPIWEDDSGIASAVFNWNKLTAFEMIN